jgi:hypothetical protein
LAGSLSITTASHLPLESVKTASAPFLHLITFSSPKPPSSTLEEEYISPVVQS